jgi:hypothetical protein
MPLPADQMRMALRHYDELERLASNLPSSTEISRNAHLTTLRQR